MPTKTITTNKELRKTVYSAESSLHGTGLFAARKIEKHEYIGTYDGPVAKRNGSHVLWIYNEDGEEPYGISGKNLLRFLNHSKNPNSEFDGPDLYAVKKIREGDEITFDYVESDF